MQATNSETQKLIVQAEALWSKLYKATKADTKYAAALSSLEQSISELYKLAEAI
jgi:hypothetical protein